MTVLTQRCNQHLHILRFVRLQHDIDHAHVDQKIRRARPVWQVEVDGQFRVFPKVISHCIEAAYSEYLAALRLAAFSQSSSGSRPLQGIPKHENQLCTFNLEGTAYVLSFAEMIQQSQGV